MHWIVRFTLLVCVVTNGLVTAATPQLASAQGIDPGAPSPLGVTREEYSFGNTAFTPPGFPGPVELTASVTYPTGLSGGPMPLVVFLHGRHVTCFQSASAYLEWPCSPGRSSIPSFRGYDYISDVLASHRYIVVSISANGINARDNTVFDRGMLARAQLIQRHLDLWNGFNTAGGAPFGNKFVGKVNLQSIGTMGHSRGGEGVVRHFAYNQSLGSPYGIKAVFPLAPVDFNRPVINNVALGVLLPYCDGDVSDLQGMHFFDDARYNFPGDSAPKHTLAVMGANHNFYNTIWTPGLFGAGAADDATAFPAGDAACGSAARLTSAQQRGTGLAYLSGFFRLYLRSETAFTPYFTGDAPPPSSAQSSRIHVSYHAPDAASMRRDVNRLLSASNLTTNTLGGAVSQAGISPYDLCGGELPQPQHCLGSTQSTVRQPHTTPSVRSTARGLSQLRGGWTGPTAVYTNMLPVGARDVRSFQRLQFRVGVNFDDARNPAGAAQDFSVVLTDGAGSSASVRVGSVSQALYYPPGNFSSVPHEILNMARVPLSSFVGVSLSDIRSVQFRFDQRTSGALLVSDIAFANTDRPAPGQACGFGVAAAATDPAASPTDLPANAPVGASPSDYAPQYVDVPMAAAALAYSTCRALVYDHNSIKARARIALTNLGIPHMRAVSNDFVGKLTSQTWDLVILDLPDNKPSGPWQTALANYVAGGGRAIIGYWDLDHDPGVAATFGAAVAQPGHLTAPPIRKWDLAHPIFNTPNAVPDMTAGFSSEWVIKGNRVNGPSGNPVPGGFVPPPPAANQGAIVVGNSGRTILNGFLFDIYNSDTGSTGKADMVRLLEDEVRFLLATRVQVTLSPTSVAFGNQKVGTTSAPQTVTLTNSGAASLSISGITSSGDFARSHTCPASLPAGGSCAINVTFTPTVTGPRNGTLSVASDAPGTPHTASLSGTGTLPAVSLGPTSLAFGNQKVGTTSAPQTVTLTNSGAASLSISGITSSGDFAPSHTCPASLPAGGSCAINVTFTPTVTGPRNGTLSVASDAPGTPHTATLAGTGVQPDVRLSPPIQDFGNQDVGAISPPVRFTVTNTGVGSLYVYWVWIDGLDAAEFSTLNDTRTPCPTTPVGPCTADVTFNPGAAGPKNAQLYVYSNAPDALHAASLAGTGVQPDVSLSPPIQDFGNQAVGTISPPVTFSVTNTGVGTLYVYWVWIDGLDAAEFSLVGETCTPGPVTPGGTCTADVTFNPGAAGPKNAQLYVYSNAPSILNGADLTGTGSVPLVAPVR